MRVSIIGAGRNVNGIGRFIAKYFSRHGAVVSCVMGTTEKSSRSASESLKQYGIDAYPYHDFEAMIEREEVDTVVISSPFQTHGFYIEKSLHAGLNIFCEKPFIAWDNGHNLESALEDIFLSAEKKGLKIAMNSQWVFALPAYERLCGRIKPLDINRFFIRLSPVVAGREMITDSMPHVLSILYHVFGKQHISTPEFIYDNQKMVLNFDYGALKAVVHLVREQHQPREFSFGFNDRIVHRDIDLETYTIYLRYEDRSVAVQDPLGLSVLDFMTAVSENREPQVGRQHIIDTTLMLRKIHDSCKID